MLNVNPHIVSNFFNYLQKALTQFRTYFLGVTIFTVYFSEENWFSKYNIMLTQTGDLRGRFDNGSGYEVSYTEHRRHQKHQNADIWIVWANPGNSEHHNF